MKISKTLKRLRNERGITQEQLAQQLFISRQSVSSWENDRTQPDIDMLIKLSEIFGVSIEELIYGKKRNTALETEKPNYNSTLIIVFAILGSLLAGMGVVLIFVYFWQQMSLIFKAVLSFLPLIAGQSAGIFVLAKKRNKIPWCEGAGVLWTAGIAATLAMIYNIFDINMYWHSILIIVSVSVIPVILLLRCVAPLAVFYGCTITWSFVYFVDESSYLSLLTAIILLAAGCVFTLLLTKKENKSLRSILSHWISIISIFIFIAGIASSVEGDAVTGITATGAMGICLLIISLRENDISMPYRIPGLLLTSVLLFAGGMIWYGNIKLSVDNILITSVACACVLITPIFTRGKTKDGFFIIYFVLSAIVLEIFSTAHYFFPHNASESTETIFTTLLRITALAANILLMVSGAREKKLLPINIGFISVAALTILIISFSEISLIGTGLLLLAFGAALLAINFRISKQSRKRVPEISQEMISDDTEN